MVETLKRNGVPIEQIWTVMPIPRWPKERRWRVRPSRSEIEELNRADCAVELLGGWNIEPLKSIGIGVDWIRQMGAWAKRMRRSGRRPYLLSYNLGPNHFQIGFIVAGSRIFRVPVCALITDLDGSLEGGGSFSRRVIYRYQTACLRKVRRLAVLNPEVLRDISWRGDAPFHLDGLLPDDGFAKKLMELPLKPPGRETRFLYAGSLNALRGVDRLLEAFFQLGTVDATLTITGAGPLEQKVAAVAEGSPKVQWRGFLGKEEERLRTFEAADIVLNPHRMEGEAARSVFPSKLGEALCSGRPVLSTPLRSLGAMENFLYLSRDDSVEGLRDAMLDLIKMDGRARLAMGEAGRNHARCHYTWEVQGAKLADWLAEWTSVSSTK